MSTIEKNMDFTIVGDKIEKVYNNKYLEKKNRQGKVG